MCCIERIVRDIGETGVIAHLSIEHVEHHAASQAQATVEPLEIMVGERRFGHAVAKVFDFTAHATCQIAAQERSDGNV